MLTWSDINKIYPLVVTACSPLLRVRQWHRFRDVLTRCAERTKDFFFIEIGANDGVTQDILHQYIYQYRWRGILVEPVPYYFEKLKCTYEANDRLALENVAISDKDEVRDFYRVREGVSHFPYWSEGLGSFDLNVVLSHRWAMPDISDYIVSEKVKCIALRSLLLKHDVKKIDLLSIDTEGYDYEIIKQIDFDKLSPLVLIYEHKHIKRDERKRCESLLRAHRYALRKQRGNTLAYLPEANQVSSRILRLREKLLNEHQRKRAERAAAVSCSVSCNGDLCRNAAGNEGS